MRPFSAEDLSVTPAVIEDSVGKALSNLTAVSLATGILTEASFPHAIMDGFKNLLAASVATDYSFEEYNGAQLISDIKSGKAAAAAAPAAAAPAAAAKQEEEEDDVMDSLF